MPQPPFVYIIPASLAGQTKGRSMRSLITSLTAALVVLFFVSWGLLAFMASGSAPNWLNNWTGRLVAGVRRPGPPRMLTRPEERSGREVPGLVRQWAEAFDLDPALVLALIRVCSDFELHAREPRAGTGGLLLLRREVAETYSVADVFDPAESLRGGTAYLKDLLVESPGEVNQALLTFHFGPEAEIPKETRERFLARVRLWWKRYQAQEQARLTDLVLVKD